MRERVERCEMITKTSTESREEKKKKAAAATNVYINKRGEKIVFFPSNCTAVHTVTHSNNGNTYFMPFHTCTDTQLSPLRTRTHIGAKFFDKYFVLGLLSDGGLLFVNCVIIMIILNFTISCDKRSIGLFTQCRTHIHIIFQRLFSTRNILLLFLLARLLLLLLIQVTIQFGWQSK